MKGGGLEEGRWLEEEGMIAAAVEFGRGGFGSYFSLLSSLCVFINVHFFFLDFPFFLIQAPSTQ